jgi:queuine tRNA-ribosyltransferase
LEQVGVEALVMNVFHLMQKPGSSTIQALGGLHKMAHWSRLIVTDSGGFQAYSLIRQNPKFGKISDQGIRFKPEGSDREFQLTPEKSVQLQMAYGADVILCLDDCTHVDDPEAEQQLSVTRTIQWAKRCKAEFQRQRNQRRPNKKSSTPYTLHPTPRLFGVVQGGGSVVLRRQCAEALLEIGFDGYGYGGWPLDSAGNLVVEMLALTRELIPAEFPLHALGVGHPDNVLACARLGYDLFDSALPTRDARNGRLCVFTTAPTAPDFCLSGKWWDYLYIGDDKHIKTDRPLSPACDCPTCRQYAVGYLRHLYKAGDTLFYRLATLHNLRFMMQLMEAIRAGQENTASQRT